MYGRERTYGMAWHKNVYPKELSCRGSLDDFVSLSISMVWFDV